jgi:hypothetical protein
MAFDAAGARVAPAFATIISNRAPAVRPFRSRHPLMFIVINSETDEEAPP